MLKILKQFSHVYKFSTFPLVDSARGRRQTLRANYKVCGKRTRIAGRTESLNVKDNICMYRRFVRLSVRTGEEVTGVVRAEGIIRVHIDIYIHVHGHLPSKFRTFPSFFFFRAAAFLPFRILRHRAPSAILFFFLLSLLPRFRLLRVTQQ